MAARPARASPQGVPQQSDTSYDHAAAALLARWGDRMREDIKASKRKTWAQKHRTFNVQSQLWMPSRSQVEMDSNFSGASLRRDDGGYGPPAGFLQKILGICVRSAFAYRTIVPATREPIEGDSDLPLRRALRPHPWDDDLYEAWSTVASESQACDGRFVFGFVTLRNEELASDLGRLKVQHAALCDMLEERPAIVEDSDGGEIKSARMQIPREELVLLPTCRAVFAVLEMYGTVITKQQHSVLLVLTGDNSRLLSGSPSFEAIDAADILVRVSDTAVRVKLDTAVKFVTELDAREEGANREMRRASKRRIKARERYDTEDTEKVIGEARRSGINRSLQARASLDRVMQAAPPMRRRA
ncbi:hypothetical protein LTR85_011295 [Meristemomyces frigidus]|nr:hypothetical protein LTR85_011295 [Meristemomyces frigidus]